MFEGKSFFDILSIGGWTLYVLLCASVMSVSVIILKFFEFRKKAKIDIKDLLLRIKITLQKGSVDNMIDFCKEMNVPVSNVIAAGISRFKETGCSDVEDAMKREISVETVKLEKYTTIVGTIGGVSVYIGLFGTVLGIIRSFHDISSVGSGGISVVIGGVSEALVATAAGLCVAIPAVIAYNFFMRTIDKFVVDMEYAVSSLKEVLDVVIKNEK